MNISTVISHITSFQDAVTAAKSNATLGFCYEKCGKNATFWKNENNCSFLAKMLLILPKIYLSVFEK